MAMLVSFKLAYFLSLKKSDLRPTRIQRHLGLLCGSGISKFRVSENQLQKLQQLVGTTLDEGELLFRALQRIVGKVHELDRGCSPGGR